MKNIYFILLLFSNYVFSQTLDLPPRNANSQNGSQIISSITNLSLQDRENYIFNEIINGNIPNFLRNLIEIKDSTLINGTYKHISYYAIPDYLALGCDTDYFLCPMTPILAQKIANTLNCTLPTRKMVDKISMAANVKMQPQTITPSAQMVTVPVFAAHDSMVWSQRQTFLPNYPLGYLVDGDKKDVIISNLIYTSQPPRKVVIYGWHYPNGNIIQPMYSGHIDTYADYSHGIRLVQNKVYVDGDTMLATDIMASQTLCDLLSDEGVIATPYYPDTTTVITVPQVPKSFCITNESPTSVKIKISPDNNVDNYHISISTDGINWGCAMIIDTNTISLLGLTTDSIVYVMIAAENSAGTSQFSEVLAATPSANQNKVLIVNGFDRQSSGNTYDFILQHGKAIVNYGYNFSSATNDAIINGLVDINNYKIADYILGEESSVDETFNHTEQTIVSGFLDNGGYLFVSGSEIAWDLDYLGDSLDKNFYHNYLKAEYIYDSPNNQSATYYEFNDISNSIFYGLGNTFFDDGTNGTYSVNYPDVITGINGGINGVEYSNLTNNYAGVYYKGIFANGTDTGKLVNIGFPFETVYPENKRNLLMEKILDFFDTNITSSKTINRENANINIYPNPAKDFVFIELPNKILKNSKIEIFNSIGNLVYKNEYLQSKMRINLSDFNSGIYFLKYYNTNKQITKKIVIQQ